MIKIKIEGTGTGNLTAGHEIPKFPSRKIFDEYEINCQNQFLTIAQRPERKSVCEKNMRGRGDQRTLPTSHFFKKFGES